MDEEMIKRAEEIAVLREEQEMTFKAIGEIYQISPGRASYLYQAFLRRRRIARFHEMYEEQNRMTVSMKMTLGELVVLQRALDRYQTWMRQRGNRVSQRENPLFEDPDHVTAEYLNRRFAQLEREKRKGTQENKDLTSKPIDFSTSC